MPTERTNEELKAENDTLRTVLAKLPQSPCVYCGLTDISKCAHGFPGCSRADDIMCGEDIVFTRLLKDNRELKEKLAGKVLGIPTDVNTVAWADRAMQISDVAREALNLLKQHDLNGIRGCDQDAVIAKLDTVLLAPTPPVPPCPKI